MLSHNPWLAIWTQPRATIREIIADNPNRSLWILASIYGFCSLMNLFQSLMLGVRMSTGALFLLAVVLSPIWGYINFTVWSWFVTWTGKWFKGEGRFITIRSAYAWSCVPITLNIPLWLLMVITFGHQLFVNFSGQALSHSKVTFLFFILISKVVLAMWSLVIYLNALAEVQKFTMIRAILNVVVAALILIAISWIVWVIVFALGGTIGG